LAQGIEESRIESGNTRELVIQDGRAVGDDTVSFAKRTTGLMANAAELTWSGMNVDRGRGRRGWRTAVLNATDGDG
jgi:hypothetical protein